MYKYNLNIDIDKVLYSLKQNHKIPHTGNVIRAYKYACEKHVGQTRKTGEAYINHPMRVAKLVADMGFESDVVIAALLHDVVEDCDTPLEEIAKEFGVSVANMVDALTAVNEHLHAGLTKKELDKLSDIRLQKHMSDKALYIKVADRIDNLCTMTTMPIEKQLAKAQHTREILLPMVMEEEAFQLVDKLEDLCFQVEHQEQYNTLKRKYRKMRQANEHSTMQTRKMLKEVFTSDTYLLAKELQPFREYVRDFKCDRRSSVSMFRHISLLTSNINNDFEKYLNKKHIPLYDMTLIVSDELSATDLPLTPLQLFYKFYAAELAKREICVHGFSSTTHMDSTYLIISDNMNNKYRLFIKTETEYLHYQYGKVFDSGKQLRYEDVNEDEPIETYTPKIKIFKQDGSADIIDAGATVLDLAFKIHTDVGLHFDYAIINGSKTRYPEHQRLNSYDTVTIVTTEQITAKLQWFNCLKTSSATRKLVEYLGEQ